MIKEQPQIAEKLQNHLMQILGQTTHHDFGSENRLDEESLRRLQSLGYVAGSIKEDSKSGQSKVDSKDILDFHKSYMNLMNLINKKKYSKATKLAQKLISQLPEFHGGAMTDLAWILATDPDAEVRDPNKAIVIAKHGAELTKYQDIRTLKALAAAQAATGHFDQAVKTEQAAIKLAMAAKNYKLVNSMRMRLQLYKQRKPFREPFKLN